MPLRAHLVELRKRLTIAALAIVVLSVAGFFITDNILAALSAPIIAAGKVNHHAATLNFNALTGAFDVRVQLAITVGIVVSSPIWLYQVWAFIVPGLKRKERRYVYGFLGSAIPLFLIGCAVGWIIVPRLVQVLTGFAPENDSNIINAKEYVDFVTKLVVAVGVGFVLPVFLVLLNFIGILTAKSILKGWRIAVLLIMVFAALVTPSADVVSMFVLALPMVGLYFAAALIAHLHDRSVAKRMDAFSAEIATP